MSGNTTILVADGVYYIRGDVYNQACKRVMNLEATSGRREMTTDNMVDSASEDRTVNNMMRHQYRVLTPEEKGAMQAIKDHGLAFVEVLYMTGDVSLPNGDRLPSRELSIAQTKIEEAVMWAVKHVTG